MGNKLSAEGSERTLGQFGPALITPEQSTQLKLRPLVEFVIISAIWYRNWYLSLASQVQSNVLAWWWPLSKVETLHYNHYFVTSYLACLHDQNKSGFFGGPAFIQPIRAIWNTGWSKILFFMIKLSLWFWKYENTIFSES